MSLRCSSESHKCIRVIMQRKRYLKKKKKRKRDKGRDEVNERGKGGEKENKTDSTDRVHAAIQTLLCVRS